ncbi:MAG: peptide chain release factor N(5)-glutamine methyltransferase [Paracoccaceae bacterium]
MKATEAVAIAKLKFDSSKEKFIIGEMYGLLCHVTGADKAVLSLNSVEISKKNFYMFLRLVEKRLKGMPFSQIIGRRSFWKSDFIIDKNVLDPRPDSECLIEVALDLINKPSRILDLGTGSGCLACSLLQEFPSAKVVAIDKCPKALKIAKRNAENLNLIIDFINSDWTNSIMGKFDLIVCNPPYISTDEYLSLCNNILDYEPRSALMPCTVKTCSGYESYCFLATCLEEFLTKGGLALFEVGQNMASKVEDIFRKNNNFFVKSYKDINGIDRVVSVVNM